MISFTGPSYSLSTRKADVQRAVNLYVKQIESGSGKEQFILEELPGLTEFADMASGEIRGMYTTTTGACYVAAGNALYRLLSDGTFTHLGVLQTNSGPVEFDANTSQLVVVDGSYGYFVTLATDTFGQITSAAFYGSATVAVIDDYAMFTRPDTGQFYITALGNVTSLDALDFATAEGAPDDLVAVVADHRQARLIGTHTTEGWFNSGDPDFAFSRDPSSYFQVGCKSPYTARRASNSVIFVGNSEEGTGIVYMSTGNSVQRISNHAVEEAIQSSSTPEDARAFVYQDGGHLFYVLNVPGVSASWVFDISTQAWHERCELIDGDYVQHRAKCHTFAFGLHLVGAADGKIYYFDRTVYTNAGDPLPRRRISPHMAGPNLERLFFGAFELDVTCGDAAPDVIPLVQMRYSNDGGATWSDWREREFGRTGEHAKRVRWNGNGSARDRVWDVQCTANARFSVISAKCLIEAGNG